jgi:hypothetical protein
MLRIQDHVEILVDVFTETLKVSNLMKDGRWNNKNVFNGHGDAGFPEDDSMQD